MNAALPPHFYCDILSGWTEGSPILLAAQSTCAKSEHKAAVIKTCFQPPPPSTRTPIHKQTRNFDTWAIDLRPSLSAAAASPSASHSFHPQKQSQGCYIKSAKNSMQNPGKFLLYPTSESEPFTYFVDRPPQEDDNDDAGMAIGQ